MGEGASPDESVRGRCANHPDVDAVGTCDRCGGFVCASCRQYYDYVPLCPECRTRRSFDAPASGRARWALILAMLALVFMVLPLGIPAVLMARHELTAIDAGEAPAGGRHYARAALVLGWGANTLLGLFVALVALGVLVFVLVDP